LLEAVPLASRVLRERESSIGRKRTHEVEWFQGICVCLLCMFFGVHVSE
jgi:hypothetical protein